MEDFSYIEELTILAVVGSLLVTAKLAACCFSLGLHTSHKNINQMFGENSHYGDVNCYNTIKIYNTEK